MYNEHILLDYAKSRQRELWEMAERLRQVRIARAARSQHQERGMSVSKQLWHMWSSRVHGIKKPVTEHATA